MAVGPAGLFTTHGQPITRIRQGKYQVNATGIALTSAMTAAL